MTTDDYVTIDDEDAPPPNGPWRDARMYVLSRKCATCIFRPGNLMHLPEGKVEELVQGCIDDDTVIPCHETLDGPRSVCRGLWDKHRRDIVILRTAQAFEVVAYDDPPTEH